MDCFSVWLRHLFEDLSIVQYGIYLRNKLYIFIKRNCFDCPYFPAPPTFGKSFNYSSIKRLPSVGNFEKYGCAEKISAQNSCHSNFWQKNYRGLTFMAGKFPRRHLPLNLGNSMRRPLMSFCSCCLLDADGFELLMSGLVVRCLTHQATKLSCQIKFWNFLIQCGTLKFNRK